MNLPSKAQIGDALAHFTHYRVMHTQEVCYPYNPIPASTMMALGYRESELKNICGGATWDGSKWVQAYTDRGWLQISDQIQTEAHWLGGQEGCPNGSWVPIPEGHMAIEEMHVPRFSPALDFVKATMLADMRFGKANGVAAGDLLRYGVAAHNAGASGALRGYKEGDVDKYTAMGDYSAYVFAIQGMIHTWIVEHPAWVFTP